MATINDVSKGEGSQRNSLRCEEAIQLGDELTRGLPSLPLVAKATERCTLGIGLRIEASFGSPSPVNACPDSMRTSPTRRRTRLWLVWLIVAFGALNAFSPLLDAFRSDKSAPAAESLTNYYDILVAGLREDGDISHYFAYTEATLGRPYVADFVRPPEQAGRSGPLDIFSMTTPTRPLIPWRDFVVEYPPGMMIPALAPALLTSDKNTYFWLFTVEMEIALTLAVWLCVRTADDLGPGSGSDALFQAILLTLALGVVAVRRYDPCVALAIAAAVHALARGRPGLSGAALGAAIVLKGAPILLAPIFAIYALSRGDSHGLARGVAGCAAILAPSGLVYALIAGPHAWDAFAYHGARPLQIQTIYGGLLILGQSLDPWPLSTIFSYGSLNASSPVEPALRLISTAPVIAGVLGSWLYAWRSVGKARDDADRLLAVTAASLACLIAFITLGKVFSPQYCVWLTPLAALSAPFSSKPARGLLLAGFVLVQVEYTLLYRIIYARLIPQTGVLILLRTACLWRFASATPNGGLGQQSARPTGAPEQEVA